MCMLITILEIFALRRVEMVPSVCCQTGSVSASMLQEESGRVIWVSNLLSSVRPSSFFLHNGDGFGFDVLISVRYV